ncbi:MAG: Gfo/Idh/MocA family oxidoreductase [Verrucomicrobiota bacterium]
MNRRQFVQTSIAAAAATSAAAQAKPDKIKIGQIGVGHPHAGGKMQVYRESDEYEVVGVVEPNEELWANAAKSKIYQGVDRISVEQLLNTDGLHAVAVETEVRDLLASAKLCIEAGFHIHLDKPAGADLDVFRQLLKDADRQKLTIQMGYMYRYNPAVQLMMQFLRDGWLGEVFEVHTVMSKVMNQATREYLSEFEGGVLFELGGHIVDIVVSVLGAPDKVTPHIRGGDDGFNDNMLAVFDYPNATATVKSAALEVEGFSRRHFVVAGTEGTFHIQPLDRPKARIALSRDRGDFKKGTQEIPFEPPYRRYVGDAIDFAKIIRGEKESDYPSSHDLAVQEALLRASGMR